MAGPLENEINRLMAQISDDPVEIDGKVTKSMRTKVLDSLKTLDADDPAALVKFQHEYGEFQALMSFISKLSSSEIGQLKEIIRNFP